jgi:hypothetical protein
MPFRTEFATVKLGFNTDVVKLRFVPEFRLVKATSEGELTRVGTLRGCVIGVEWKNAIDLESDARYARTSWHKPIKVPELISTEVPKTKSSAASISILPALPGREAMAMRPSTSPVLTSTVSAKAEIGRAMGSAANAPRQAVLVIAIQ